MSTITYETWDDGIGGLKGLTGSLNYTNGDLVFDPNETLTLPVAKYEWETVGETQSGDQTILDQRLRLVGYEDVDCPLTYVGGPIAVSYYSAQGETAAEDVVPALALTIDLTPSHGEHVIADSVDVIVGGVRIQDDGLGGLVRESDQLSVGSIDYETGLATLTTGWTAQAATGRTVMALATWGSQHLVQDFTFRVPGTIVPGSVIVTATSVNGDALVATGDLSGEFSGTQCLGDVNYETGLVQITWGDRVLDSTLTPQEKAESWYDPEQVDTEGYIIRPLLVLAETVRYSAVIYTYVPLDADILGLDPVRLPVDGRVPIYRVGTVCVIHNTDGYLLGPPAVAGQTYNLGRQRIARVRLLDANGLVVPTDRIESWDLDAGTITLADPLDLSGFTEPVTAYHTVEDMVLLTDVEIGGALTMNRPVTHDYPADESYCSGALLWGDTWARYSNLFGQYTWTNTWSDERDGNDTVGQYNDAVYPIEVTNKGAIEERWRINFTSSTAFQLIGEHAGLIAVGDINTDLMPINPVTSVPYFTMHYEGWGTGWAAGNQVRFNTYGPRWLWAARTVEQGPATSDQDSVRIVLRGDVDAS